MPLHHCHALTLPTMFKSPSAFAHTQARHMVAQFSPIKLHPKNNLIIQTQLQNMPQTKFKNQQKKKLHVSEFSVSLSLLSYGQTCSCQNTEAILHYCPDSRMVELQVSQCVLNCTYRFPLSTYFFQI